MNYVSQALDSLKTFLIPSFKRFSPEDAFCIEVLCQEIEGATKFLLPKNGNTGLDVSQPVINMLHVPFPCIVFEYDMAPRTGEWQAIDGYDGKVEASTKRLSVVWRISKTEKMTSFAETWVDMHPDLQDKEGILVASVFSNELNSLDVWATAAGLAFVEIGSKVASAFSNVVQQEVSTYQCLTQVFLEETHESMCEEMSEEQGFALMRNDLADEVTVALTALACVNSRNVHFVDIEAPAKLNKKRLRLNKTPLFAYKVLDIFINKEVVRNRNRVDAALKGLKSGCPLSAVRGHFKIRKTGIFWWSDHTRGAKENGVIIKDYNVKEA